MAQTFTHNLLHPHHWLTWSGLGLLWLLVQLLYPVLHILGSGPGKISRPFLKRREGIAIRNIEQCFPEMTPFARSQMVNKKLCFSRAGTDGNRNGLVLERCESQKMV